jgi:putative acetyltransferase
MIGATSIQVRPESPTDVPAVDELVGRAFDGRPNEVELVRRLRESDSPTFSRVATVGGRIVGHVMYSQLGLEGSPSPVLTLAPVSVEPGYQNRGVGTRVITASLSELDDVGVPSVVVLGEPNYYRRFGFEPVARYGITAPTGFPMAHLMILPLGRYDASLVGTLIYPSAFRETGTISRRATSVRSGHHRRPNVPWPRSPPSVSTAAPGSTKLVFGCCPRCRSTVGGPWATPEEPDSCGHYH